MHGSGEKLEGPAMEALVRSWRERLWSFGEGERVREKRETVRERSAMRDERGGWKKKKKKKKVRVGSNPT